MNAEPHDVKVGEEARRRGRRKHCGRRGLIDVIAVVVAFVNNAGAVGAGGAAAASIATAVAAAATVAAVKNGVVVIVGVGVAVAVVAFGAVVAGAVEVVHTEKTSLEVIKARGQGRQDGDLQPNRVKRATKGIYGSNERVNARGQRGQGIFNIFHAVVQADDGLVERREITA
jgi:hypothetical protein